MDTNWKADVKDNNVWEHMIHLRIRRMYSRIFRQVYTRAAAKLYSTVVYQYYPYFLRFRSSNSNWNQFSLEFPFGALAQAFLLTTEWVVSAHCASMWKIADPAIFMLTCLTSKQTNFQICSIRLLINHVGHMAVIRSNNYEHTGLKILSSLINIPIREDPFSVFTH